MIKKLPGILFVLFLSAYTHADEIKKVDKLSSLTTVNVAGQPVTNVDLEPYRVTIFYSRTPTEQASSTYTWNTVYLDPFQTIQESAYNSTSMNIMQNGTTKQSSSLFLRGTDSNHTLLTLNGISIRDESTVSGADDISQHSSVGLDRVSVIKGPAGSLYGANAVAGVVDMTTSVTANNYVLAGYGSNKTFNKKIKLGRNLQDTIVSFEGDHEKSDSISVHARGSERDPYSFNNFALQQKTFYNDWIYYTGYIQNYNFTNLDSSGADVNNYTANWRWRNFQASASNDRTKIIYNRSMHDRKYNNQGSIDKFNSVNNTVLVTQLWSTSDKFETTTGYEFSNTAGKIDTTSSGYVSAVDSSRTNNALFANSVYKFNKDQLINISARADTNTKYNRYLTGRIGGYYHGFKASVANGFRLPTFYELYGVDNYGFSGNPNLNPERSISYEVGYKQDWFDITFFHIKTKDAVAYVYDPSTFTATYQNNSGASSSQGVEVVLKKRFNQFEIKTNTTYNNSVDSLGVQKLRRPQWSSNAHAIWNAKPNLRVGMSANYTGQMYDLNGTTFARFQTDSVATYNFFVEESWFNEKLTVSFKINNIADKKYEQPSGYAQLGRSFYVAAKYNF